MVDKPEVHLLQRLIDECENHFSEVPVNFGMTMTLEDVHEHIKQALTKDENDD